MVYFNVRRINRGPPVQTAPLPEQVGLVMTAVCNIAGMTAKREAGSGLPMSP